MAVPTDIANLKAWYKADAITGLVNGDVVPSWPDSSAGGFVLANATTAQRPTYIANGLNGLPVVRFDGVDDGLFTNTLLFNALGQPYTVFAVYNYRSTVSAGRRAVNGSTSQAAGNWLMGPYNALYQSYVGAFLAGPAVVQNQFVRQVLKGDGATAFQYVNGAAAGSVASTAAPPGGLTIGYSANSWFEPLDGDVAEVIVYSAALSDPDRASIDAYLVSKWFTVPTGVTSFTTTITDDELVAGGGVEGNNLLKVFVKDAAGNWST